MQSEIGSLTHDDCRHYFAFGIYCRSVGILFGVLDMDVVVRANLTVLTAGDSQSYWYSISPFCISAPNWLEIEKQKLTLLFFNCFAEKKNSVQRKKRNFAIVKCSPLNIPACHSTLLVFVGYFYSLPFRPVMVGRLNDHLQRWTTLRKISEFNLSV